MSLYPLRFSPSFLQTLFLLVGLNTAIPLPYTLATRRFLVLFDNSAFCDASVISRFAKLHRSNGPP